MITIKVKGYKAELLETEQLPTGPINYAKVKFIIDTTDTEWTGAMLTATFLALTPRGAKIAAPAPVGAEGIALVPERILSEKCSSLSVGLMGTWVNEGLTSRITTNMVNVGVSVPGAGGADFDENITPADLYEYLEKILAEVNSVLSKIDELEDDVDDLIAGAQTDWDQTDDEAYDFLKNKPDIPEVKAVAITKNGQILNYSYDEILSMWDTGVPMTYEGKIVFSLIKESVRARLLTVTGEKGNYEIIETQFTDDGTYARVTESKLYSFSPLHGIDTADGNPLTISNYKVQLPDYVLASTLATALEAYYTKLETYSKTEVDTSLESKIDLPSSANDNDVLTYEEATNTWKAKAPSGGDAGTLIVHFTKPASSYVADKTNAEIYDAYDSGVLVYFEVPDDVTDGLKVYVPLIYGIENSDQYFFMGQMFMYDSGSISGIAVVLENSWQFDSFEFHGGASSADAISYDNTNSGLSATDVQAAIDELAQGSGGSSVVVSDTAPSSPTEGMLWVDTDDDTLDVPNGNALSY